MRELRGLRAEAKSASRFKEQNYQLENKVMDLSQRLRKRDADTKELSGKVATLEQQLAQWQGKHDEAHAKARSLESELAKPTVPLSQWEQLVASKDEVLSKLREAEKRVDDREGEIVRLTTELEQAAHAMEAKKAAAETLAQRSTEDSGVIAGLRAEVNTLKEQISRTNALNALTKNQSQHQRAEPISPTFQSNGYRSFDTGAEKMVSTTARRHARRHSTTGQPRHARHGSAGDVEGSAAAGLGLGQAPSAMANNGRVVSYMPQANGGHKILRDSSGLPIGLDNPEEEVMSLLHNSVELDEDVLQGLIYGLKIPQASAHNPPLAKEVIFPAHLISVVNNEMWKVNMIPDSERFFANVMHAIQDYVVVSP